MQQGRARSFADGQKCALAHPQGSDSVPAHARGAHRIFLLPMRSEKGLLGHQASRLSVVGVSPASSVAGLHCHVHRLVWAHP